MNKENFANLIRQEELHLKVLEAHAESMGEDVVLVALQAARKFLVAAGKMVELPMNVIYGDKASYLAKTGRISRDRNFETVEGL